MNIRKKYKMLKTSLELIKFNTLLKNNSFLSFYHIQYSNSLDYAALKKVFFNLNLQLNYYSNFLLKRMFISIMPNFYINSLFSNNILVVSSNSNNNLYHSIKNKVFNKKALPLFVYFQSKFFYLNSCLKYDCDKDLKSNIFFKLTFILQSSNYRLYLLLKYLKKKNNFHEEL